MDIKEDIKIIREKVTTNYNTVENLIIAVTDLCTQVEGLRSDVKKLSRKTKA